MLCGFSGISGWAENTGNLSIPVISYPQEEEARAVIERVCKENNSSLYIVDKNKGHFLSVVNKDKIYQKVEVEFKDRKIELDFALLGEHQITNLLVALKGISLLEEIENIKFTLDDIKEAVKKVQWKGRLEVMKNNPLVVIDGAHNIQGIKTLNENVHKYFTYKNIYLLLGILADKQVEDMVKVITPGSRAVDLHGLPGLHQVPGRRRNVLLTTNTGAC